MNNSITAASLVGKAEGLAEEIERRIVSGELQAGDRLPAVRHAAEQRGLAANTVAAAYQVLARRGLVEGRGRKGTVVTASSLPSRSYDIRPSESLLNMSDGNPDLNLLPDLRRHMASLAAGDATLQLGYGAPQVDDGLRSLVAKNFAADEIGTENIAVVGGALDGIERALSANLRSGDGVAVEDPGYRPVRSLLSALGLRAVAVELDEQGPKPSSLSEALDRGVKAVVITPRAQNPTGIAVSLERAQELGRLMRDHPGVLLIEDDHANAVAGAPFHSVSREVSQRSNRRVEGSADSNRWVVVRSMAKSYGPDLRVAAVVGDRVTIGRIGNRLALGMGWVPHIIQRLVASMLSDTATNRLLEEAADAYRERRNAFYDEFVGAGLADRVIRPSSGFNVWVLVDDETVAVAAMADAGYAVAEGARFRLASPPGVRVSVAAHDEGVVREAARHLIERVDTGFGVRLG